MGHDIRVHKFWTVYKPDPNDPAKMIGIDMVSYGPLGEPHRSANVCSMASLQRVQPLQGSNNIAVRMAHERLSQIEPLYNAWKAGQEPPVDGTPLAAWNALTPEQAEMFRTKGVKTVEQFASLTDSASGEFQIRNLRTLINHAKAFLDASEQKRLANVLAEKNQEIEANRSELEDQKLQIASLLEKVNALAELAAAKSDETTATPDEQPVKRGPGRPRKPETEQEAVA